MSQTALQPIHTLQTGSKLRDTEVPTREQIAELAYYLWERRGCPPDSPEEDWFLAEEQLRLKTLARAS